MIGSKIIGKNSELIKRLKNYLDKLNQFIAQQEKMKNISQIKKTKTLYILLREDLMLTNMVWRATYSCRSSEIQVKKIF